MDSNQSPTASRQPAADYWSGALKARTSWIPAQTSRMREAAPLCDIWDEEIDALQHQVLVAKSRRNALSPICAILPEELLAHIFEELSGMEKIRALKRDWGWARVTQVCRHFRSVALAHSSLWATISPNMNCPWDMLLRRARDAPLHICGWWQAHVGDPEFSRYKRDFVKNRHRIRTLDLSAFDRTAMKKIIAVFDKTAPELRILRLRGSAMYGRSTTLVDRLRALITSAPNIEEIDLRGVPYPWPAFAQSLRILKLGTSNEQNARDVTALANRTAAWPFVSSLDDILEGLRRLPMLETLAMEHIGSAFSEDTSIQHARVVLPRLERLELRHQDSRGLRLWSLLDVPPGCSTDMICTDLSWSSSFDILTSNLAFLLSKEGSLVYNAVDMSDEIDEQFEQEDLLKLGVYLVDRPNASGAQLRRCPGIRISAQWIPGSNLEEIIKSFMQLLPRADAIYHVNIMSSRNINRDVLQSIFEYFTSTQSVHLSYPRSDVLDDVLRLLACGASDVPGICLPATSNDVVSPAPSSQAPLLLPSLSTLSIGDTDLGEEAYDDSSQSEGNGSETSDSWWDRLVQVLSLRAHAGHGVKKLSIRHCDLPRECMDKWECSDDYKRSGIRLDWDHSCGYYEPRPSITKVETGTQLEEREEAEELPDSEAETNDLDEDADEDDEAIDEAELAMLMDMNGFLG
ncbi:unnamed protein product [Peniophora sp. CBMAI 1063]|nr:unnamed protein product [Peniophora sp. CBMAI 1063]